MIVARSRERLDTLAGALRDRHGVDVLPIALDLAASGAADELIRAITDADITVDVLINNAGVAVTGPAAAADSAALASMIGLNVTALTETTVHFAERLGRPTSDA